MHISDLEAKEQPAEIAAHILRIRQNGSDLFESLHRAKDGTVWPVEVNAAYWPSAGGRTMVFLRDITGRKQAEEVLVERARLAALGADIGIALTRGDTLREVLRSCSEAIVQHLDAAFARIWTLNPQQDVLELQASAGMYTHIDGPHGRVPVGHLKIGLIAQERRPHLTNAVIGDPRVGDQEWAQREGMVAFAGYPLVVKDRLVGVIALFAHRSLTHATLQAMASVADEIALGIEQKRAEEALRDSEAKLQAIVNTAVDAIITIDVQGTVLSFNPSAERVFGFAADEVLGRNVSMLMPLPHSQEHGNHMARYLRTGERRVIGVGREIPAQRKDGTVFPMEIGVSEIRVGGNVIFVGILRDITERKAAEEEIRKLNASLELMVARRTAELESMLANATIGLAFFDRDFRFIRINRCLAEIDGIPVDAHLGRPLRELLPEIAETVEPIVRRIFETGRPHTGLEIEGMTPAHPGERRTWLESYYPVLAADGTVISVGATVTEITERKRAEEELAELNRELRQEIAERERVEQQVRLLAAVLEASPDLVGIADPSGRVLHLNRAFSEALGRSPETEPLMIRDCHPPEALRIFEEEGLPTAARLGVWRGETEFVTWDGRSIPMSQLILGHSDAQGSLQFYSTIMRDISERKQMEEALRLHGQVLAAANAELARAARLKDEFLASMSHELRTPLNGILNISQGLYEQVYGTMNSRQQEALHDVEECGRHLLSLINDILDLAKVEAGKIEVEPGPIAVERFCQATIRLVKESAQKKRLRLSLRFDESVGILISDERRLKQILVNLLSNAVKFTPEGGEVALEVAGDRAGRQVCFTVRDTGIGISLEDLARLFQPFVQIDSRLSRNYPGTGLGLSLVKRLTTLLGGETRVESQPGVGSRFTVVLPWIEESRAPEPASTLAGEPGGGPRRADEPAPEALVVVIEDNPFNAKGLCDYLCFKGFRVEWASNALDGIGLTQRLQPSLVVMDIQMPGMDGLEAIQRIRQLPAIGDVPIIALTALAMPGDRERCLKAGATDYIAKPVVLDDFFQLASKLTSGTCTISG